MAVDGGAEALEKERRDGRKSLLPCFTVFSLDEREVVSRETFKEIFLQLSDFSSQEWRPVL